MGCAIYKYTAFDINVACHNQRQSFTGIKNSIVNGYLYNNFLFLITLRKKPKKFLHIGQRKNLATVLYKEKTKNNFDEETKTKKIKTRK